MKGDVLFIMTGIYKITNKINGKVYIGQSINIERRWKEHISDKRKNSLIHLAIEKYGEKNFNFEIIEECS
jgi:group I intron endonuclease